MTVYNPEDRLEGMVKVVGGMKYLLGAVAFIGGLVILYKKLSKNI